MQIMPFIHRFVLMLLAFVLGLIVAIGDLFPYPVFRDAYRAAAATVIQWRGNRHPLQSYLWTSAETDHKGVTRREADRVQPGFTLYTSGDGSYARLIDLQGRVVHEWQRPYSEVWTENAAVDAPQPDHMIYMRRAQVLPNGDLLAIYTAANDTPCDKGVRPLNGTCVLKGLLRRSEERLRNA